MVWLSALWHLVGALPALPDLSPAAVIAGIAVAVLAVTVYALTRRITDRDPQAVAVARRRDGSTVLVRVSDPDAPGRPRPRAPSR
jgi:Family of unknown function (DUF6412)